MPVDTMPDHLLQRGSAQEQDNRYAPPAGTRVYAIGDIHGRCDLLVDLQAMIAADLDREPPERAVVIYLGDYIDRGSSSYQAIDRLIEAPVAGAESVHLRGNHEALLLHFLAEPDIGRVWLNNGGEATLRSYNVASPEVVDGKPALAQTRDAMREAVPPRHLAFFDSLALYHVEGGYTFVHAGIRPGLPLADQEDSDLLWIRGAFLDSRADHGCCVVHGHTISRQAEIRANRIGIDTGAFFSNVLTCVVLEGTGHRWLQTRAWSRRTKSNSRPIMRRSGRARG